MPVIRGRLFHHLSEHLLRLGVVLHLVAIDGKTEVITKSPDLARVLLLALRNGRQNRLLSILDLCWFGAIQRNKVRRDAVSRREHRQQRAEQSQRSRRVLVAIPGKGQQRDPLITVFPFFEIVEVLLDDRFQLSSRGGGLIHSLNLIVVSPLIVTNRSDLLEHLDRIRVLSEIAVMLRQRTHHFPPLFRFFQESRRNELFSNDIRLRPLADSSVLVISDVLREFIFRQFVEHLFGEGRTFGD